MSTRLLPSLRSSNGVVKRVPAFDSLCRARTGVDKRVLAFDGLCRARTRIAKRAIAFDSLCRCGVRTEAPKCLRSSNGVRKCLLAFDRPSYINWPCIQCTYLNCVIIDLSFKQILQLFEYPGKSLIIVFHKIRTPDQSWNYLILFKLLE